VFDTGVYVAELSNCVDGPVPANCSCSYLVFDEGSAVEGMAGCPQELFGGEECVT
jgi:hypothetical protein